MQDVAAITLFRILCGPASRLYALQGCSYRSSPSLSSSGFAVRRRCSLKSWVDAVCNPKRAVPSPTVLCCLHLSAADESSLLLLLSVQYQR